MKVLGVFDAKNRLSELIDGGEPVTITRHGKPVAVLTPVRAQAAAVAARIRAMAASGGVLADNEAIVEMLHSSRR
jgi:prevent-host-death family protein